MISVEDAIYKVKQAAEIFERTSFNANVEPDSWQRRQLVEKVEAAETRLDDAILTLVAAAKAEEAEAARDAYIEAARAAIFTQAKARRVKFSESGNKSEPPTV